MPNEPRTVTLEAGDTAGAIDYLSTPEHNGALVEATLEKPTKAAPYGSIHVRVKAFINGDQWDSQEVSIPLNAPRPDEDDTTDTDDAEG